MINENQQIKLLSFDVDNTLIDLQTLQGNFTRAWRQFRPTDAPLLAYNTGRLRNDILHLITRGVLPEPDYIISGVGTHIYDFRNRQVLKEFNEILDEGWDIAVVESIINEIAFPIELQPSTFQHSYKRSYYFHKASPEALQNIEQSFSSRNLHVNVVYSGEKYLDILPQWANKGNALRWLLAKLNLHTSEVLVAGDSGNDSAMFELPDIRGIAVANTHEELYQQTKYQQVYHAEREKGDGVIEGLIFYGIFPQEALDSCREEDVIDDFFVQQETEHQDIGQDDEKLALIGKGYREAVKALKRNITPLGFSACSIADNTTTGTDQNYQSVWARDGAITIIGSLPLVHDKEVNACQLQTFQTLFDHISPNGQIPSNVRIKDNTPDYSGVGGICSIDSGIWMIIAFFEYITATENVDFLRANMPKLQRVMDWLSAHDSNNDALLEIPEAGDWTDLFGRRYNVLYDEILWYRANVCFGRLLEMLGDYKRAGDYIRWSQVIKKEILLNFWPSTQQQLFQAISFAEQQYSLGDTPYLLAQITPFDFSWRCDALGNILAFLYGVTDTEQAQHTFQFMLGVGLNEPFPVANVYPVVTPGDPDWRPYYTVNLLNLPHHYHNGGIWPFVGGFWVKFVSKMGLEEMALSEMYKLALLNKQGINSEWEFTEWAHGTTGKPMGKAYQAWSAAQYISAYHYLNIKKG